MDRILEARAAWVYRSNFSTVAEATAYLAPMAEAGLNLIYPGLDPATCGPFVDAAHKLNIEVHPIVSGVTTPPNRPDLRMIMPSGRASGQNAACPSNPEVRRFNIDAILALLQRVPDLDGVHLDWIGFDSDTYHGSVALSYCYCPRCREGFRKAHGADPLGLVRDTAARPDLWSLWTRSRCDAVNAYAAEIRQAIKSVRTDLMLSATAHQSDGAPDILHEPYVCSPNFQEWGRWMADGTMDFFCPMPYTVDNASFRTMLQTVAGAEHKARGRSTAYPGIGLPYLIDPAQLGEQIDLCRRFGVGGFSLFFADSPIGGHTDWWPVIAQRCSAPAALPHRAANEKTALPQ